jgi:hypothetical protein
MATRAAGSVYRAPDRARHRQPQHHGVLKKLFTRAKRAWGLRFDREPDWRAHMLKEADERVRELHEDEAERLDAAMRDDYAPLFDFVRATGQRKSECYL